mgnify:CR=1 FL=1
MTDIRVTIRDTIDPALAAKIRAVSDPRPILEAMGLQLLSITQSAFNNPSERAAPWPAKKDGTPATLRRHQTLFKGWRVGALSRTSVSVVNDRRYAWIHQFGGQTKPHVITARHKKALAWNGGGPVKRVNHPGSKIPARPMLPIIGGPSNPRLAPLARAKIQRIGQAKLEALLRK